MPPVGSWPGGLVSEAEPSPPSLPAAQTVTTPSSTRARCSLTVAEFGSNSPPPGRAVRVVGDLDRRALGRGDPGPARRLVVLQHPVERGVRADDQEDGAGGDRDDARARRGALEL